jgi:plasmid replication initiation protein
MSTKQSIWLATFGVALLGLSIWLIDFSHKGRSDEIKTLKARIAILESYQHTPVPTNGGVHYYYHSTNLEERP